MSSPDEKTNSEEVATRKVWRHGRLNWLQQNWLRGDPNVPETEHENSLIRFLDIPRCGLPEVLDALVFVVARHESIRTVVDFNRTDGSGFQTVHAPPRSPSDIEHVFELVERGSGGEIANLRRTSASDIRHSWPVRFVVEKGGRYVSGVHVVDHSATDGWGIRVLTNDLLSYLAPGGSLMRNPAAMPQITQPLDIALWEDSASGIRRSGALLNHWRGTLGRLRERLDGGNASGPSVTPRRSRFTHLTSPHLQAAAATVASRLSVSVETVFLCAFAWSLTSMNDTPAVGIQGLHNNRFAEADRRSAALRFTQAPVVVEMPQAGSVDRLIQEVYRQRLTAVSAGHAAPHDIDAVVGEILPEAMSAAVCGALFNFMGFGGEPSLPIAGRDLTGSADEIVQEDSITERGAELMLSIDMDKSTTRMSLTTEIGSLADENAFKILRFLANTVYRMASTRDWLSSPLASW